LPFMAAVGFNEAPNGEWRCGTRNTISKPAIAARATVEHRVKRRQRDSLTVDSEKLFDREIVNARVFGALDRSTVLQYAIVARSGTPSCRHAVVEREEGQLRSFVGCEPSGDTGAETWVVR
jgi:hypothetical protein